MFITVGRVLQARHVRDMSGVYGTSGPFTLSAMVVYDVMGPYTAVYCSRSVAIDGIYPSRGSSDQICWPAAQCIDILVVCTAPRVRSPYRYWLWWYTMRWGRLPRADCEPPQTPFKYQNGFKR